jgi:hypothetical protein
MKDGIDAFLIHHKEDAATSTFSGGFILQPPSQSPEQYVRMMKSIWITRCVQSSEEYYRACESGNRLLKCFVEELGHKCLNEFNRFANPDSPRQVRNAPSVEILSRLGDDSFLIWPKVPRPLDRFDAAAASVDPLKKILLRAQMHNRMALSRHMELLLVRHDETLLEMIIKETAESDQATDSRS